MEPLNPLTSSKQPATYPYSEAVGQVHTLPFHLFKIHFNIILQPKPSFPSGHFRFLHQTPARISFHPKRKEGINKLNQTHITKKFGMFTQTETPSPTKVWPTLTAVANLKYNIKYT